MAREMPTYEELKKMFVQMKGFVDTHPKDCTDKQTIACYNYTKRLLEHYCPKQMRKR